MIRLLAFAIVLSAGLTSCKSSANPPGGVGVSAIQFQDVVVPSGMTLQDNYHESWSLEEAGYRSGHFVYRGAPRVEDASAYVLDRMPQHAWSLSGDETKDKARVLRFTRGVYEAEYSLQRVEGVTQIVVEYRTGLATNGTAQNPAQPEGAGR
jgi:hypothetical protein